MHDRLQGLYVITDHKLALQRQQPLEDMVAAAIEGGARIVQYRNKSASVATREHEAHALASLCKANDVVFLINDDIPLALTVDADGVHLGQSDAPLAQARAMLGQDRIIGITCHDQIHLALSAQQAGTDYVAFGRFFPSVTKPEAPPAALTILQEAHAQLHIPIAAIGGITPANAKLLLEQGVDMLAVIHGVLGAADIVAAAGEYTRLFTLQSRHAV
ncbi:MAG: thiamine phosphate synthase [Gammaproteobacteria bacterium]|nr:thiamine phosphate synthase [Gammaproteobacteria bacterium]